MVRGLVKAAMGFLAVIGVLAVVAAVAVTLRPSLNPFTEKTTDRTGPSVLKALNDLSDYHAANAYFETVVDLQKERDWVPSWVDGERVLYVGKGTVDAMVSFKDLGADKVSISEDRQSVSITLPKPTLGKPVLDIANSQVVLRDSGFLTKFKGSDLEKEAQLTAIDQMTKAAAGQADLTKRAEENTRAMLHGLFTALGFTSVTVTYQ